MHINISKVVCEEEYVGLKHRISSTRQTRPNYDRKSDGEKVSFPIIGKLR